MTITYLAAVVLATNGLLLFVSIYWTASSWNTVRRREQSPPWLSRTCTVTASTITVRHRYYRNEFAVESFTLPTDRPSNPPTTAFRYVTPIYNQTHAEASNFSAKHPRRTNSPCWVEPPSDPHIDASWTYSVSLTPGHAGATQADRDMAILSTVFAVVACLALVTQLICVILARLEPVVLVELTPRRPPPARARGLPLELVDALCRKGQEHAKVVKDPDVCAICLEEDVAPVAALPCHHVFHVNCIRAWLLRGGSSCPLCNFDLAEDKEKKSDAEDINIEEDSSSHTTGLHQAVEASSGVDMAENGVEQEAQARAVVHQGEIVRRRSRSHAVNTDDTSLNEADEAAVRNRKSGEPPSNLSEALNSTEKTMLEHDRESVAGMKKNGSDAFKHERDGETEGICEDVRGSGSGSGGRDETGNGFVSAGSSSQILSSRGRKSSVERNANVQGDN